MPKKQQVKVRKVKAFGIVGVESGALYTIAPALQFEAYFDGFAAEDRMYQYQGRGQMVHILPITITYTLPTKKPKNIK